LQTRIGVNFFDRTQVALLIDNTVQLFPLKEVKQKKMQADTLMFNNLVSSKGELSSGWMQPAGKSWLARYI
jgi:hypothetical protein